MADDTTKRRTRYRFRVSEYILMFDFVIFDLLFFNPSRALPKDVNSELIQHKRAPVIKCGMVKRKCSCPFLRLESSFPGSFCGFVLLLLLYSLFFYLKWKYQC
ncbi:uncharacterized protein [Euphorbia lathyris]|uniref:uncharacterized protein isoform X2 n=1 Tax=Euphorbia lathyris TaxID=212925 RepID=UPI003313C951